MTRKSLVVLAAGWCVNVALAQQPVDANGKPLPPGAIPGPANTIQAPKPKPKVAVKPSMIDLEELAKQARSREPRGMPVMPAIATNPNQSLAPSALVTPASEPAKVIETVQLPDTAEPVRIDPIIKGTPVAAKPEPEPFVAQPVVIEPVLVTNEPVRTLDDPAKPLTAMPIHPEDEPVFVPEPVKVASTPASMSSPEVREALSQLPLIVPPNLVSPVGEPIVLGARAARPPEPVAIAPMPIAPVPEPIKVEPLPVAAEPAKSEPIAPVPEPIKVEPLPIAVEPLKVEPIASAPEPIKAEPMPVMPTPVVVREPMPTNPPTPEVIKVEPLPIATPEPIKPEPLKIEPVKVPEPDVTKVAIDPSKINLPPVHQPVSTETPIKPAPIEVNPTTPIATNPAPVTPTPAPKVDPVAAVPTKVDPAPSTKTDVKATEAASGNIAVKVLALTGTPGMVQWQKNGAAQWLIVEKDQSENGTFTVRTGPDAGCELQVDEGTRLRLGRLTRCELSIKNYADEAGNGQRVTVNLIRGMVYVTPPTNGAVTQVKTPAKSIPVKEASQVTHDNAGTRVMSYADSASVPTP